MTFGLTVEPTASFWDAGEYIATAAKLQVGHPPGAPLFQMMGAFFALFYFFPENIALWLTICLFFPVLSQCCFFLDPYPVDEKNYRFFNHLIISMSG